MKKVILILAISLLANVLMAQSQRHKVSFDIGYQTPHYTDFGSGYGFSSSYSCKVFGGLAASLSAGYYSFGRYLEDKFLLENVSMIPVTFGVNYTFEKEGVEPYLGAEIGLNSITSTLAVTDVFLDALPKKQVLGIGKLGLKIPFQNNFNLEFAVRGTVGLGGLHSVSVGPSLGLSYSFGNRSE